MMCRPTGIFFSNRITDVHTFIVQQPKKGECVTDFFVVEISHPLASVKKSRGGEIIQTVCYNLITVVHICIIEQTEKWE